MPWGPRQIPYLPILKAGPACRICCFSGNLFVAVILIKNNGKFEQTENYVQVVYWGVVTKLTVKIPMQIANDEVWVSRNGAWIMIYPR